MFPEGRKECHGNVEWETQQSIDRITIQGLQNS
jgi:hypothetical protein